MSRYKKNSLKKPIIYFLQISLSAHEQNRVIMFSTGCVLASVLLKGRLNRNNVYSKVSERNNLETMKNNCMNIEYHIIFFTMTINIMLNNINHISTTIWFLYRKDVL